MSAGKWTPGPWGLETVQTSAGSCHRIGPFPSLGVYPKTHACVYADNIRIGIDEETKIGAELLANARLIAAAPDLLEALQDVLGFCAFSQGMEALMAIDQASAAIAKARGEAS